MMMYLYEVHDMVRCPADDEDDGNNKDHGSDSAHRPAARPATDDVVVVCQSSH